MTLPPDHTTRMAPSPCPVCGKTLDAHTGAGHTEPPSPGGLSICIGCLHLRVFADDLTLRELTPAEQAEARIDPGVELAIRAIEEAVNTVRRCGTAQPHDHHHPNPEGLT